MKSFLLMLLSIFVVLFMAIPAMILNIFRKLYRREDISKYFKTTAIGFDQAGGSILYGQEDFTVSSWTYHLAANGNKYALYFMRLIDFFFGIDHCTNSFKHEIHEIQQEGELK